MSAIVDSAVDFNAGTAACSGQRLGGLGILSLRLEEKGRPKASAIIASKYAEGAHGE